MALFNFRKKNKNPIRAVPVSVPCKNYVSVNRRRFYGTYDLIHTTIKARDVG